MGNAEGLKAVHTRPWSVLQLAMLMGVDAAPKLDATSFAHCAGTGLVAWEGGI